MATYCNRCNTEVSFKDVSPDYYAVCPTHDEDLYKVETYEAEKPVEVIDPCWYCGHSTAFGSGRFVNRLPVETGWGCAECSGFNCDECDTQIYLDCEVRDAEGWNYHPSCLPLDQHVGYDPDDPDDEGCGCDLCDLQQQATNETTTNGGETNE